MRIFSSEHHQNSLSTNFQRSCLWKNTLADITDFQCEISNFLNMIKKERKEKEIQFLQQEMEHRENFFLSTLSFLVEIRISCKEVMAAGESVVSEA